MASLTTEEWAEIRELLVAKQPLAADVLFQTLGAEAFFSGFEQWAEVPEGLEVYQIYATRSLENAQMAYAAIQKVLSTPEELSESQLSQALTVLAAINEQYPALSGGRAVRHSNYSSPISIPAEFTTRPGVYLSQSVAPITETMRNVGTPGNGAFGSPRHFVAGDPIPVPHTYSAAHVPVVSGSGCQPATAGESHAADIALLNFTEAASMLSHSQAESAVKKQITALKLAAFTESEKEVQVLAAEMLKILLSLFPQFKAKALEELRDTVFLSRNPEFEAIVQGLSCNLDIDLTKPHRTVSSGTVSGLLSAPAQEVIHNK